MTEVGGERKTLLAFSEAFCGRLLESRNCPDARTLLSLQPILTQLRLPASGSFVKTVGVSVFLLSCWPSLSLALSRSLSLTLSLK